MKREEAYLKQRVQYVDSNLPRDHGYIFAIRQSHARVIWDDFAMQDVDWSRLKPEEQK